MSDVPEELAHLCAFLQECGVEDQISFWEEFLKVHRRRIANTEVELCPALLTGVEQHIEYLKAL